MKEKYQAGILIEETCTAVELILERFSTNVTVNEESDGRQGWIAPPLPPPSPLGTRRLKCSSTVRPEAPLTDWPADLPYSLRQGEQH